MPSEAGNIQRCPHVEERPIAQGKAAPHSEAQELHRDPKQPVPRRVTRHTERLMVKPVSSQALVASVTKTATAMSIA
ncbi:hypothetical protein NDU88_010173 [Pleurodeles waltl]|uniref:Uncharacterized protein n=1 Tax=Pleurodeles waltl TaxID=8319 RepID=A0AAV7QTP1_PLEWA|nr:hypothetical protein NDU88_010173 [Pleurodeles waltl]